ncbi:protein of unknown function [Hyphomicrobium sp. MC1]|nr:protein of unknown function [Hyphomicrobium sp. MC1]
MVANFSSDHWNSTKPTAMAVARNDGSQRDLVGHALLDASDNRESKQGGVRSGPLWRRAP